MKPVMPSREPVPPSPGYFTRQPQDSGPTIHFSLSALDGMLAEVMTGFGAIPRRGAEVGGILLGRAGPDDIWIESFAMAECEHRRGPSFLLSEQDEKSFIEGFEQHRKQEHYPVGLFRSNTREENAITDEDRVLFRKCFEPPAGTFLLVRPYATKTSTGVFLTYRDGMLPDSSPDVFPFQRWELEGGPRPQRRPLNDPKTRVSTGSTDDPRGAAEPSQSLTLAASPKEPSPAQERPAPAAPSQPEYFYTATVETNQKRRGWVWIPLSFIFLLLGVLLGFQSALTFYPRALSVEGSSLALGLTAAEKENNLHIRWNRESPVIQSALRGRLEIQDGKYSKTVDLDPGSLQTGSVMYPPVTGTVSLRLEVSLKGNTSVVESLEWSGKQKP